MSKFCTNCGAQADDAAFVCGNCGTPFGAAPVEAAVQDPASGKASGVLKKILVPVISVIVVLALALGALKIFQSVGVKGAVRKGLNAGINGKADKLASVLSIRYGEKESARKKSAKELDFYLTNSESKKYKITYKIKGVKDMPSDELEDIQESIAERFDEDEDYVSDAKIVKVQVTTRVKTTKEKSGLYKGDYHTVTKKVIMTKENGKWKYYGYYSGDDDDD